MVTISFWGWIGNSSNSSKIFLPDGIFSHQFYTYGPSGMLNSSENSEAIENDSRRWGRRSCEDSRGRHDFHPPSHRENIKSKSALIRASCTAKYWNARYRWHVTLSVRLHSTISATFDDVKEDLPRKIFRQSRDDSGIWKVARPSMFVFFKSEKFCAPRSKHLNLRTDLSMKFYPYLAVAMGVLDYHGC